MEFEVKMPDLSTTAAEVKVVKWLVEVGQQVARGEALLEVETDKATVEVESVTAGQLKKTCAQPGDDVPAGQTIAILETEGESAKSAPAPASESSPAPKAPEVSPASEAPKKAGGMFAKNRQQAPAAKENTISLSVAQRKTAERLTQSKQTIPHFYIQASVNADNLVAKRKAASKKIAWDAFFVHAIGKALTKFDHMCYRFEEDKIVRQSSDAVGVAIDIENNLYVIPITDSESKNPEQISDEIYAAVEQLKNGDPKAASVRPGAITLTNLGISGVDAFLPIISPPEASILGIGKIAPKPVAVEGQVAIQNSVSLTLSVDHRVVSGRYAADFLKEIIQNLESL